MYQLENGSIGTIDNNPFTDRDPRLYETVMIVGDHFQSRPAEMWIGGLERGSETDGGRAPSGFCIRKFLWDYNQSTFHDRPANYAYLRMAEIHLAYGQYQTISPPQKPVHGHAHPGFPHATPHHLPKHIRYRRATTFHSANDAAARHSCREALHDVRIRVVDEWNRPLQGVMMRIGGNDDESFLSDKDGMIECRADKGAELNFEKYNQLQRKLKVTGEVMTVKLDKDNRLFELGYDQRVTKEINLFIIVFILI